VPINPVRGTLQSVYGGTLAGPQDLLGLAAGMLVSGAAVPEGQTASRITHDVGRIVGYDARDGYLPTQHLTEILRPAKRQNGPLPSKNLATIYPGCP
jgi:hypothetical protein